MPHGADIEVIKEKLISYIAELLGIERTEISPEDELAALGMDSIRLVEILIFVEREYGIKLMDAGLSREALQSPASLAYRIVEIQQNSHTDGSN